MANVDRKSGLTAVRHYGGGTVRANEYKVASALGSNIFTGDLVKSVGTDMTVTVCAAGDRAVGVFRGCQYFNSIGEVIFSAYWPTGTVTSGSVAAKAMVIDDPEVLFEVQATTIAAGDVGNFADITAGTAGSTITGISGMQLDGATLTATTATGGQLKVVALADRVGNAYGSNAKVLVLINEHELRAGTTAGEATQAV